MSTTVGLFEELISIHSQLASTMSLNIVAKETSVVVKLYDAVNEFLDVIQGDVESFGVFLYDFENNYISTISMYADNFKNKFVSFWKVLSDMRVFQSFSTVNQVPAFIQVSTQYWLTMAMIDRSKYSTYLAIDGLNGGVNCTALVNQFNSYVSVLVTDYKLQIVNTAVLDVLLGGVMAEVYNCQSQYGSLLTDIRTWLSSVALNETLPTATNFDGCLNTYAANTASLRSICDCFSTYQLSMYETAGQVTSILTAISSELANVTSTLDTIRSEFLGSLATFETAVTQAIAAVMAYLNSLALYNPNNTDINIFGRNLTIWKSPSPQIHSNEVHKCYTII